jgi:hypothetical protein
LDYKMIYLAKRNPSCAPEDWPKLWRSHPREMSQYPVIGSYIEKLSYCARVLDPRLDGEPFDPPGVSRDYDGVAVVSSPSPDMHEINFPPEVYEKVLADERRVFSTTVENFAMKNREVLTLGDVRGPAAVIRFLARRPGLSHPAFVDRWTALDAGPAEAALAAGRITRHVRNAIVAEPPPGYDYDATSETWFASEADAVRAFADPALAPLVTGLPDICDPARCVTMLTHVVFRLPRE